MNDVHARPCAIWPCPECAAGKHGNCDGTSWDASTDTPTTCTCHEMGHPK